MLNICNFSPIKAKKLRKWDTSCSVSWKTDEQRYWFKNPKDLQISGTKRMAPLATPWSEGKSIASKGSAVKLTWHLAALRSGEGMFYARNGKTSLILLGEKSFKIKGKHISGKHKVIFYLNSYTIKTLQIIWENKGRKERARDLGGGTSTVEVLRSRQQQLQRPQLLTQLAQL